MWDVIRIRKSVDSTWKAIEQFFTWKSYYPFHSMENETVHHTQSERIDPSFRPDLTYESTQKVKKHLVWMHQELQTILDSGNTDKAQRWLGFMQGAFWAMGMVSIETLKESNRSIQNVENHEESDIFRD